jgi:hypothetical protein
MSSRDDDAWLDAGRRFEGLIDSLPLAIRMRRPLPPIRLRRVTNPNVTARIRRAAAGNVSIEFGDEFLSRLVNLVEHIDAEQLSLLLAPTPEAGQSEQTAQIEDARLALYAIGEQFVIHHELFHLLCGHLDQRLASSTRRGLALEELSLAALRHKKPKNRKRTEAMELALFIELEADSSAAQFLFDKCLIGDLAAVFPDLATDGLPLSLVEGPGRAAAFRLCFAAIWLVLLLFEGLRVDQPSGSHPWPATRLLALLFTLLPYFADIADEAEAIGGERFAILTEHTASSTREFMLDVVRPAMKFVLAHGDAEEVLDRYKAPDPTRSSLFADVLHDLQGLIFDTPLKTQGGSQLLSLIRKRPQFTALLEPYRYFDA